MSRTKRDKRKISLNSRHEVSYLKQIAREIVLKTKHRKGYFFIHLKGRNKDFYITPVSVIKVNRLARAVIKALVYKRIDSSKLKFDLKTSSAYAWLLLMIFMVLGILIGYFAIPIIQGVLK